MIRIAALVLVSTLFGVAPSWRPVLAANQTFMGAWTVVASRGRAMG